MFCTSQLIKANIRLDNKMIDDVIRILDGLRSAYAQIVPGHEGKSAPTQAGAGPGALPKVPGMGRAMPKAPPMYPAAPSYQPASAPSAAPAPATGQARPDAPSEAEPPAAPQAGQDSAPPQARNDTPESKPEPPRQPEPPKPRTAFNAAKFRAANAYGNNNR
jgi:flagellar protein FliS